MADLPIGSPDWLSCALRQLEEELSVEGRTQEEREQQLESCAETLQLLVDSVKTILSNHNRQLADVKHLLRAMAKVHGCVLKCLHYKHYTMKKLNSSINNALLNKTLFSKEKLYWNMNVTY